MNKTCKVCGRTCSTEDMQCPSCRSQEFEGHASHIEAYAKAQSNQARANKLQEVEHQIGDLSSLPVQWERPLFYVGIGSLALFFLLPKVLGKAALVIGGIAFALSLLLSRSQEASKHLEAKAEKLRRK